MNAPHAVRCLSPFLLAAAAGAPAAPAVAQLAPGNSPGSPAPISSAGGPWRGSFCETHHHPGDGLYGGTPWPGGIVYYTINPNVPDPQMVLDAMAALEAAANLTFIERTTEQNWIEIRMNSSMPCSCCAQSANPVGQGQIGMAGGLQYIQFSDPCSLAIGTVMHEIMHALGLWHEQQRPDRDQYVQVHPAFVNNGNYAIQNPPAGNMHGAYDFASLMHYDQVGFLSNGQLVRAIAVRPPYARAWQYELDSSFLPDARPSSGDIWVLQNFYGGTPPPRAFALTGPASGAAVGEAWTPSFSWAASEAATLYRLQVSLSPVFDSPEIDIQTSQTSYTHPSPLQPRRLYWWRVIASNAQGTTQPYPLRSLTLFTAASYPATLFVDDSAPAGGDGHTWSSPLRDLAVALEAAAASESATTEIRVAQGIYTPDSNSGDRARAFWLADNCAVLGGYAGFGAPDPNARDIDLYETILSGDLNGDDQPGFVNIADNSRNVVFSLFNPAGTLLEGLTIRGANCDPYGNVPGIGGVFVDGGNPTIRRCRFVGNHAEHGGPGLIAVFSTAPVIEHCRFAGNRTMATQPSIFASFGGGSLFGTSTGIFPVTNCIFEGNAAVSTGGGAAAFQFAFPRFTNCLFDGNTAGGGGGAVASQLGSQAVFTNCTVVNNSASGGAGGVSTEQGAATIANSILWGNTPSAYAGSVAVSYSAVQGGAPGAGNIPLNPGFEPGTFRLAPASPCIDAGNSTLVPAGIVTDLCGNPRFHDDPATPNTGVGSPPVDMGACEFQGVPCYANCDNSTTPPVLNVNDFVCFQQRFAAADPYANCDNSTTIPILNVNDFVCFQQQFAAGCP